MYQGKIQDNVPWDEDTVKACVDPGTVGYYGQNFKECYRYKQMFPAFIPSKAIDNCDWRNVSLASRSSDGPARQRRLTVVEMYLGWCFHRILP